MSGIGMNREEFYNITGEAITNTTTHSDMFNITTGCAQEASVNPSFRDHSSTKKKP